jgi:hypothetical protein
VKDIVIKFPKSKRKLTKDEQRLVRSCSNLIYNVVTHENPFIKSEQRICCVEEYLETLIKKIHELDEDKK